MEKSQPLVKWGVSLALVLLLVWPQVGWGGDAGGPDQAMASFIQAMRAKNAPGVLGAFAKRSPWQYLGYEVGSGRLRVQKTVAYAEMEQDFQNRTGWHHFFFDEPNGYTFQVNFLPREKWVRKGNTFVKSNDSPKWPFYIKWRQEGSQWVIAEIGETTP